MQIHFYDKVFRTARKESTFKKMCSYINKVMDLDPNDNYIYEYSIKKLNNTIEVYRLLNEQTYNRFYGENVSQIFIYYSLEETKTYRDNDKPIILEREPQEEEDDPNFYQEENEDENSDININNIQEDIFLKEKIKQTIINQQKQKIRESRLKQEKEERERLEQQNKINLNIKNANDDNNNNNANEDNNNNNDNNENDEEIINIIEQNFEKFKDNLINESKAQATQIIMESKLKLEQNKDLDIETPNSVERHNGIACNGCDDFPIVGIRYKCVECSGFDFCEKCYKEKKFIHKHPFYKLRFIIN